MFLPSCTEGVLYSEHIIFSSATMWLVATRPSLGWVVLGFWGVAIVFDAASLRTWLTSYQVTWSWYELVRATRRVPPHLFGRFGKRTDVFHKAWKALRSNRVLLLLQHRSPHSLQLHRRI